MAGAGIALLMLVMWGAASASANTDDWTRWAVTPTGDENTEVNSIAFPLGGTMGFAGSLKSGVLASTNAGLTWSEADSGLADDETDFVRSTQGAFPLWQGNGDGLYTSANGQSWSPVGQGPGDNKLNEAVNDVYAVSASDLVAGTASGGIFTSGDGGNTWIQSTGLPPNPTLFELTSTGPGAPIYAATSDGLYVSFDEGSSWTDTSDGLPYGEVYRVAVVPGSPNDLYTTVYGDGVYSSDNAGVTWTEANGTGPSLAGPGTVGELAGGALGVEDFQLAPKGGGRAIIATDGGVFATVDGGASWSEVNREVNPTPPGGNPLDQEIVMAIDVNPAASYLLAGTRGHGAYFLPFAPLTSDTVPTISGTVKVGSQLTASIGTWHGTLPAIPTIAWDSSTSSSCSGESQILDPSTNSYAYGSTFTPFDALQGEYIQAVVSVKGLDSTSSVTAKSACTLVAGDPDPNYAPYFQSESDLPAITPEDPTGYTPWGQQYTVSHGTWVTSDPVAAHKSFTYAYQWLRCDSNACSSIPGATASTYTSTHQDVGETLEAEVTVTNYDGSDTVAAQLETSIIEKPPVPDPNNPPKITGDAYIGSTLHSDVGDWSGYGIDYDRTWEACDPDGTDCSPFANGTTQGSTPQNDTTQSSVTLTEAQRGEVIKLVVIAHNRPGQGSDTEADSALTAVVGDPPPPVGGTGPGDGSGSGTPAGGGNGSSSGTQTTSGASAKPGATPSLSKVSLTHDRFRIASGSTKVSARVKAKLDPVGTTLRYTLSEAATVTVKIERLSTGRISRRKCVRATAKLAKAKKCALATVVTTLTRTSRKGANSVAFTGRINRRALALGSYRMVVTATASGRHSAARTLSFTLVAR